MTKSQFVGIKQNLTWALQANPANFHIFSTPTQNNTDDRVNGIFWLYKLKLTDWSEVNKDAKEEDDCLFVYY